MALVNSLGQRTKVDSTGQIHGTNNRGWEWGYNTSGEVNAGNGLRLYPFHNGHGNITSYSDMITGVLAHREPSRVARGEMDEAQRSPQGGGAGGRPHHQYESFNAP